MTVSFYPKWVATHWHCLDVVQRGYCLGRILASVVAVGALMSNGYVGDAIYIPGSIYVTFVGFVTFRGPARCWGPANRSDHCAVRAP
jgi:hypothetical protein